MVVEIDGEVTVKCDACDNGLTFIRPNMRLDAGIMASRLEGYFTVDSR